MVQAAAAARRADLCDLDRARNARRTGTSNPSGSATSPTPTASEAISTALPAGFRTCASSGVDVLHLMSVLRARIGRERRRFRHRRLPKPGSSARFDHRDSCRSIDRLRQAGISLCLDLVMNHTSSRARLGHELPAVARPYHRALYRVYPRPDDARRVTRRPCPRCSPTWRPATSRGTTELDAWVWTTFREFQWDLNWANPDVFVEMRRHRPVPRQPRCRRPPPRRRRIHRQAARHELPEPARSAPRRPGLAGASRDGGAGDGDAGRGDRRPGGTGRATSGATTSSDGSASSPTTTS